MVTVTRLETPPLRGRTELEAASGGAARDQGEALGAGAMWAVAE
ncbi:MAG TPA: hypothetical protein VGF50_08920 [Caulobacteraceae bacterium]|jgi:hypothetical protein